MTYEYISGVVEEFCNQASTGNIKSQTITLHTGTGTLIYVQNGDKEYQDIISRMFGVDNAYEEWKSDFVLFRANGSVLAVGTYTPGSAAEEENEVAEFTKVLITEVDNLRIDSQITAMM